MPFLTDGVGNMPAMSHAHEQTTKPWTLKVSWSDSATLNFQDTKLKDATKVTKTADALFPPSPTQRILASDGATSVRCKIPAGLCISHHHLCPYLCTHYMLMEWAQLLLMNTIYFNKEWAHVCGWWSARTCQIWKASSAPCTFVSLALFSLFTQSAPCLWPTGASTSTQKHNQRKIIWILHCF